MTGGRHLTPGPWKKSAAWRGGSFMLGLAALIWLLHWVTSLGNFGVGRLTVGLVVGGLTLSVPYGLAWLRGELPPPAPRAPVVVPEHVNGAPGATYVIVAPPEAKRGGMTKAVRPKELTPGWYALYTVLWRWPVLAGDALLSGLWSLAGRLWGSSSPARSSEVGTIDHPEKHPAPDRTTF